jgi:hypothetical protein
MRSHWIDRQTQEVGIVSVFDYLVTMMQSSDVTPQSGERPPPCKQKPPWHWVGRFARQQRACGRPQRPSGTFRAPREPR